MFRMRGLKRAAAAISGNGCCFGLVAGDGVSAIEVPLGSRGAEQENAAAPNGAAASLTHMFPGRETQLLAAADFCLAPKLPTIVLVPTPGPTSQLPAVSRSVSVRGP